MGEAGSQREKCLTEQGASSATFGMGGRLTVVREYPIFPLFWKYENIQRC